MKFYEDLTIKINSKSLYQIYIYIIKKLRKLGFDKKLAKYD